MRVIKVAGCIVIIFLVLTTALVTLGPNQPNGPVYSRSVYSQVFRPFYSGYQNQTSVDGPYTSQKNLTAITREWNFEGWAVEKLTMVIQWSRLQPGLGNTSSLTLYISSDGGISYSTTISIDNKIVDYNETGPGRFYSANATYDLTRYASLFSPLTRVIIQINPVEAKSYLSIVYWGSGQKPVPPFDYTDEAGNYIQYCVSFQVSYRENIIPYTGSTLTDSNAINASNVNATANLIVKTMHPSGASNEYVGKQFGTDSWIVTYSTELAMISLIDVSKAIPDQNYLPVVKHYIPWLFSKQMPDGSFLFTLTDGDQHPWSNESSWVGYDKIDSFSALSITLMRKYYDATGDLTMVNQYFPNLALSKNFLANLVDKQRWIPMDGYHYNNSTGYTNSTICQLQDSVEVYQSLEDYAYLEGIRGNSQEQRYWEAYANAVANGIRMLFWNETLQRYSGSYDLLTNNQQTVPVYSQLTPVICGIENNASRAAATVQSFVNLPETSRYGGSADNRTVDSMVYISLVKIKESFNPSQPWIEEAFSKARQTLELTVPSEQRPVETLAWELNALLT